MTIAIVKSLMHLILQGKAHLRILESSLKLQFRLHQNNINASNSRGNSPEKSKRQSIISTNAVNKAPIKRKKTIRKIPSFIPKDAVRMKEFERK